VDIEAAYNLIRKALDAGRPAHGYLLVGDVRGHALALAERVLTDLFTNHVEDRANPDIHWIQPEKKSRIISVQTMRERLLDPMSFTSYQGGWKAGVVVAADRLNKESANAFLKMLEEPPPRTIFLLLAENPEQLLPTIISRCQRIDLDDARRRTLEEPWHGRLLAILADETLGGIAERAAAGGRLAAILEELKDRAEELVKEETGDESGPGEETSKDETVALVSARYREFRGDFLALLMSWFRDLAAVKAAGDEAPLVHDPYRELFRSRAARLTLAQCFRNIEAIEEAATALERSLPDAAVMSFLADRLAFGAEGTVA